MTGTERRVWYNLRGRRLSGFKFRRQLPIGPYFADFVCLSNRLVVEIDGGEHHEEESDRRKTAYLESQGFRVRRIPASDTDQDLYEVLNSILAELQANRSSPP
jgi:very-short-patch-repair endonuclease